MQARKQSGIIQYRAVGVATQLLKPLAKCFCENYHAILFKMHVLALQALNSGGPPTKQVGEAHHQPGPQLCGLDLIALPGMQRQPIHQQLGQCSYGSRQNWFLLIARSRGLTPFVLQ